MIKKSVNSNAARKNLVKVKIFPDSNFGTIATHAKPRNADRKLMLPKVPNASNELQWQCEGEKRVSLRPEGVIGHWSVDRSRDAHSAAPFPARNGTTTELS